MDFLLGARAEIEKNVFASVATLLHLEVNLLFFDTTMTHFEVKEEDGLRRWGRAGALHAELPQALIGMAVTKEGIPVKAWVWPGNTSDQAVVAQVKREWTAWRLGRLVWVMDRGMTSEENAIRLQEAGHHFIMGERMRSSKAAREALSRPGRYRRVCEGLRAKEVVVGVVSRLFNPATPPAKNSSRQRASRAAETFNSRETTSSSSPRRSRITASAFLSAQSAAADHRRCPSTPDTSVGASLPQSGVQVKSGAT